MALPFRVSSIFWILWNYCLFTHQVAIADQIVYLNRSGNVLPPSGGSVVWEPFFFPKSINTSIGEQVHFVALFDDISDYLPDGNVRLLSESD